MSRPLAALAASLALAACTTTPEAVIVDPSWAEVPSGDAMSEAYPMFASMIGLPGAARVRCAATPEGRLADCRVEQASPEGVGFETAALAVAPLFRVNPRQVDGAATKADVRFTVRFEMADEQVPEPWTGATPAPEAIAAARGPALRYVERHTADLIVEELDVSPDREAAVRAMIRAVDGEFHDPMVLAVSTAMARVMTREQIDAVAAGRRPPAPMPTADRVMAANDAVQRLEIAWAERLRETYCAAYDCTRKIMIDPDRPVANRP